ncbi:MAG: hypothetical protein V2I33_20905 [Kangiellaceae bacterium]|nr:hypothetical protein [Kangiellaceae bacterium]
MTYRKLAISFISVFLYTYDPEVQGLTVIIVIFISFYLQSAFQPFETPELNRLEMRSIGAAGITIYCGLYFLTKELGDESEMILFVAMVWVNCFFLGLWAWGLMRGLLIKVAEV